MRVGQTFGDSTDDDDLPELTDGDKAVLDAPILRPLRNNTEKELMEELALRYEGFVFHAYLHKHDDKSESFLWFHGNYHSVVGLIQSALWKFQREYL